MDDDSFDGTRALEQLAEVGLLDAFFEAVETDDLGRARSLLTAAGLREPDIAAVLVRMQAADGDP